MTKAYKILLSNKVEIKFDEDEMPTVTAAIESGQIGNLRQGMFNPSFLVAIVKDEERLNRFYEAINESEQHNQNFPTNKRYVPTGFRPLEDIFAAKSERLNVSTPALDVSNYKE